ncbi:hypothetical protein RFI_09181 [Reticulomyxa filosa]|uniref:Uncharacterized protein n=1 Tax=Reticulomyxa filosa TaxID=46433 RepID=X6NNW7_RETFI|nr:hypothetical protein RFI_09181 [Reticulomyxa filosa]|eukprot:ETO27960.1 hypothetical protein RFI_09181 [Reticulomyxa filosa]
MRNIIKSLRSNCISSDNKTCEEENLEAILLTRLNHLLNVLDSNFLHEDAATSGTSKKMGKGKHKREQKEISKDHIFKYVVGIISEMAQFRHATLCTTFTQSHLTSKLIIGCAETLPTDNRASVTVLCLCNWCETNNIPISVRNSVSSKRLDKALGDSLVTIHLEAFFVFTCLDLKKNASKKRKKEMINPQSIWEEVVVMLADENVLSQLMAIINLKHVATEIGLLKVKIWSANTLQFSKPIKQKKLLLGACKISTDLMATATKYVSVYEQSLLRHVSAVHTSGDVENKVVIVLILSLLHIIHPQYEWKEETIDWMEQIEGEHEDLHMNLLSCWLCLWHTVTKRDRQVDQSSDANDDNQKQILDIWASRLQSILADFYSNENTKIPALFQQYKHLAKYWSNLLGTPIDYISSLLHLLFQFTPGRNVCTMCRLCIIFTHKKIKIKNTLKLHTKYADTCLDTHLGDPVYCCCICSPKTKRISLRHHI